MADIIYNNFIDKIGEKAFDMSADSFKIVLLDNTHTPSAADVNYADVSAEELATAGNYTAGGVALANQSWVAAAGVNTFDADDVSWANATFTARYAVIFDDTVADDPLVCLIDFLEDKTASAVTFEIRFHADGIMTLQQGT